MLQEGLIGFAEDRAGQVEYGEVLAEDSQTTPLPWRCALPICACQLLLLKTARPALWIS